MRSCICSIAASSLSTYDSVGDFEGLPSIGFAVGLLVGGGGVGASVAKKSHGV